MIPLDQDLRLPKKSLLDFKNIAIRVLDYLPNILSGYNEKNGYKIHWSFIAGTTKYVRPINQRLFIYSSRDFKEKFTEFEQIILRLTVRSDNWIDYDKMLIDSILYTIQQAIGAGFDLLVNPNSARKHVGNRFEELINVFFTGIGISNKKITLQIPYRTDKGVKIYQCENDLLLSPFTEVKSHETHLDENEVVVSIKTTSKDRMGKIFIDKILLQRFVKHNQKVIGIFLNDVQRKGNNNISFTLVSNLFMVYTSFLIELEGTYYLDPPPVTNREPFKKHMKSFSELVTADIWSLLSS